MADGHDQGRSSQVALITEPYRQAQSQMHATYDYGTASIAYAPIVAKIMNSNRLYELLDYGAGKGNLLKAINADRLVTHAFEYTPYEPSNPVWATAPRPSHFVACIDVLEHIEPDCLDDVLDDLKRVTSAIGFFTVATGPAVKVLPDGRNAHLIQEGPQFWLPKIMERFDLQTFQANDGGFMVTVLAKDFQ